VDKYEEQMRLPQAVITNGMCASLLPGKMQLAPKAFRCKPNAVSPVPRPQSGYKTCKPSAHTQQFGIEFCIRRLTPSRVNGKAGFSNIDELRRTWAAGLLPIVSDIAVDQGKPIVLVSQSQGCFYLAVLSLGYVILGWPLRLVHGHEDALELQQNVRPWGLEPLLITNPCPMTSQVDAFVTAFSVFQIDKYIYICINVFMYRRVYIHIYI
jgi:hypothetical protein